MSQLTVKAIRTSTASPDAVYLVLEDVPSWPQWVMPLSGARFERTGAQDPKGTGAIRAMHALGRQIAREEIVEAHRPHLQRYRILSGLPVRAYDGTVRISPDGSGSRIDWAATFTPRFHGTGRLLSAALQLNVNILATGLARAAERFAPPRGGA